MSSEDKTLPTIDEKDQALGRAERRGLRRIFNGRTVPIVVNGLSFMTFKEASRYLLTLTLEEREAVGAEMKSIAASEKDAKRSEPSFTSCD